MRRHAIAVAAVLCVAGAAAAADTEFCARVLVGTETLDPLRASGVTYSVGQAQDLHLLVAFLGDLPGDHLLEVKLVTPNGHLYQTLTAPITAQAGEGTRTRTVPRYPRPLPVQVLQSVTIPEGRASAVEVSFPVAGTSIAAASLFGAWGVELLLDGSPMGCEVRNFFVLTE